MLEHTLLLVKPDAVHRGLVGEIISSIEKKGFKIHELKSTLLSDEDFYFLYPEIEGKPFHNQFKAVMQSAPSVLMVVSGHNAVQTVFQYCGTKAKPEEDFSHSIRQKFSIWTGADVVHRACDYDEAKKQLEYFFENITDYQHNNEMFMASNYWDEL